MSEQDAFDTLALEPRFDLSFDLLEKAYRLLQTTTHPDVFAGQPEVVRLAAARQASRITRAYQQLKDPLMRAEILLKRQGVWPIISTPDALEEAMALREAKGEAPHQEAFEETITALYQECLQLLTQAFQNCSWPNATQEYLRLSYLQKMVQKT